MAKVIEQIVRIETDGNKTKAEVIGELVRCKDCKYWNESDCHSTIVPNVRKCMVMNVYTDSDQFCKYGERKETEDAEIH